MSDLQSILEDAERNIQKLGWRKNNPATMDSRVTYDLAVRMSIRISPQGRIVRCSSLVLNRAISSGRTTYNEDEKHQRLAAPHTFFVPQVRPFHWAKSTCVMC
eukprot:3263750-Pyramimonas_sp.AAC.1